MTLANQVALVTGAGQGIGKASALALATAGTHVVVADIAGEKAEATAEAIMSLQRRALPVQADVGNLQDIDRMVRRSLDEFGQIDILLNNAGVTRTALSEANLHIRAQQEGVTVEAMERRRSDVIPLKRANDPEDIAAMVVFLASPGARNITGQSFNVDGGLIPD